MIYLMCNIGTRDIELSNMDLLERDGAVYQGKLVPRVAGAEIIERGLYEHISVPIIEKALQYVRRMHPDDDVSVFLFCSDQPESVAHKFRANDTLVFAEIIKHYLVEQYDLVKKRIRILSTSLNPADYDKMYEFYSSAMEQCKRVIAEDDVMYLLLAGGTPAMNTMLLFGGGEHFQTQAKPIYLSPERRSPIKLDVNRQIARRTLARSLREVLAAYAYKPAKALVAQHYALDEREDRLLHAIFEYAQQRRHFKFDQAIRVLDDVLENYRHDVLELLRDDLIDHSEIDYLREVVYLAEIAAETGDWLDFLTRLHRFEEGLLQLACEKIGVRWSNKERTTFHEKWWNDNRSHLAELKLTTMDIGDLEVEKSQRYVDRTKMSRIIFSTHVHDHKRIFDLEPLLHIFNAVIPLRNRIVHRFEPVTRAEIEAKAQASIDSLIRDMKKAFEIFSGQVVPPNPYDRLNDACLALFAGDSR